MITVFSPVGIKDGDLICGQHFVPVNEYGFDKQGCNTYGSECLTREASKISGMTFNEAVNYIENFIRVSV